MRKLLVLTFHFPPSAASGAFRLLGFARHLPHFGWSPSVIAPPTMPGEPVDQALLEQISPATTLVHVPYPKGAPKLLRWAVGANMWLPRALAACEKHMAVERPDMLLTSGPPHQIHLLGMWLKRKFGIPWTADFRDPWVRADQMDDKAPWKRRWQAYWERRVHRSADIILANAPGACDASKHAYPGHAHKIITLTNGFDPFDTVTESPSLAAKPRYTMVHAGELYQNRDLRPLLHALANGQPSPAVDFTILGRDSQQLFDFDEELLRLGLQDRVNLRGQVPYGEARAAMRAADLLLLLDSPGRKQGVPAKLYEYLACGRPILALAEPDCDTARVLRACGAPHRVAAPSDVSAIRAAILELVAMREDAPASRPNLTAFTRTHIARCLAQAMDACLDATATPELVGNVE